MDNRTMAFLNNVCAHVNCKVVHEDIREELTCHIEDLSEGYRAQGYDDNAALAMAIDAMGDSNELGHRLNQQHRLQTDWPLIGLTSVIAVIGAIVMYTSSKFETMQAVEFKFFISYMAIGITIMMGVYFFDYTKLKRLALPIYLSTLTFLIVMFFYYDMFPGGMKFRIIGSGSGACKYATLLFLISFAGFIENRRGGGGKAVIKLSVIGLVSVVPILALSCLPQGALLILGYAAQLSAAVIKKHFGGSRRRQLSALCLSAAFAFTLLLASNPYRWERFALFAMGEKPHPESVYGWLQSQVEVLLAASKWIGAAASGNINASGIERVIPSLTVEYALVNVIASLGWMVGIALVAAIAAFIVRSIATTMKINNNYGYSLSLGVCVVLAAQFALGILINFNMFPLMAIDLPFVSYGRTDYIVNMMLVGIILSVWRRNNIVGNQQFTLFFDNSVDIICTR